MRKALYSLALPAALLLAAACSGNDPGGFGSLDPDASPRGQPTSPDAGSSAPDSGVAADVTVPPVGTPDAGNSSSNDSGAPATDTGTPPAPEAGPNDGFDAFQHHNLDVVNMYRATKNIPPLVLDKTLCDFALAGAVQLSMDHTPHQHFINAEAPPSMPVLWMDGFKTQAAENQGDPMGWFVMSMDAVTNEMLQIDDIQKQMFNEGPGSGEPHGHYNNMMDISGTYARLGVGLLEVQGKLYLTNDFSD